MDEYFICENTMIEWGQLKNLIWLWVIPAVVLIFFMASFRKRAEMKRFGDIELVQKLVLALSPAKRMFKRALILLVLTAMVVALAQPHFRKKETLVERKGIDIMIAIDVSNSMLAKDIAPSRLEKAKLELAGLIDKLKGNRLGIVAYAGEAIIQCPLTLDRSAVKLFLSSVSPGLVNFQGTAIGQAILVATKAFQEKEKDSKALILITDGEDHDKDTLKYVKQAKDAGVRIFTIGIGTPDGSTLSDAYGAGNKKDRQGRVVITRLNESFLRQIARETGGVYYRSSKGEVESDAIAREIAHIAQKGLKNDWTVEYEESFQTLLLIAVVLLLIEMLLSEGRKT